MFRRAGVCNPSNESDRFITARSSEREKIIHRFLIKEKDQKNLNKLENLETPTICKSAEPKTKTPLIIRDQKQISDKIYLSLLKTQLFKPNSSHKNYAKFSYKRSLRKKRKKSPVFSNIHDYKNPNNIKPISDYIITDQNYDIQSPQPNREEIDLSFSLNKFDENSFITDNTDNPQKKLNFYDFNLQSEKINNKRRKYDLENLNINLASSGNKTSFSDLINFEICKDDSFNCDVLNKKKISSTSYKVLDAPQMKDDFYLHLIDWSRNDLLAVGLENTVYLWDSKTSAVQALKTYSAEKVTSVNWMHEGNKVLVGLNTGKINIFDVNRQTCVNSYYDHSERVGVFSCNPTDSHLFSSGSLDHDINNYDIRTNKLLSKFQGHTQEVCGLEWSHDGRLLASGGNDNKLILWSLKKTNFEKKFNSHRSAVKAIGWSYQKYGLLASGGGTQDRTIKLWNTNEMKLIESIDTTSQVCNLTFSKITNEFVSTHGYSDNLILVWDFEKLEVIATLKGHRDRVIYLASSPEGRRIVTGAGDETIRFWEVFKPEEKNFNSPKLKKIKFR